MTRKRAKTRTRQQRKALRRKLSRAWHRRYIAWVDDHGTIYLTPLAFQRIAEEYARAAELKCRCRGANGTVNLP